jgi:hypothetical protein
VADTRPVQVVVGTGPLGLAVSRELRHKGEPFRLVSRGGHSKGSAGTEIVVADVSDAADARRAFEGASVVYQCAVPRYSQWPALMPRLVRGVIEGALLRRCAARVWRQPLRVRTCLRAAHREPPIQARRPEHSNASRSGRGRE